MKTVKKYRLDKYANFKKTGPFVSFLFLKIKLINYTMRQRDNRILMYLLLSFFRAFKIKKREKNQKFRVRSVLFN